MKKRISYGLFALLVSVSAFAVGGRDGKLERKNQVRESVSPEMLSSAKRSVSQIQVTRPRVRQAGNGLMEDFNPTPVSYGLVPRRASGAPLDLRGAVTYGCESKTVYKIPTAAGQDFEALSAKSINASYGGVADIDDQIFFAIRKDTEGWTTVYKAAAWDMTSWDKKIKDVTIADNMVPSALAWNPVDGKVYGNLGNQLCRVDYLNNTREVIADLDGFWWGCAFDAGGNLYAIDGDGNLCSIDVANGSKSVIGATGIDNTYTVSSTIDTKTGKYYHVNNTNSEASLFEVDLTTGAATKLYSFSNYAEIVGLYVQPAESDDKAPAAATNLTVDFPQGKLNGKVSFTAPSTTFDGASASGEIAYVVQADGKDLATGKTSYGENVSVDVAVEKSGSYDISVYTSNETGRSPQAKLTVYIGNDKPMMKDVTLQRSGKTMTLKWSAASSSESGGYFDPSAVTYDVVRYPEGETVANGISATEFTETLGYDGTPKKVYYGVTAVFKDLSSEEISSNGIVLGHVVPPYVATFDTLDEFDLFTTYDVNEDGKSWVFCEDNGGFVRHNFSTSLEADDWIISPAVHLEAGSVHKISFDAWCERSDYPERLTLAVGTTDKYTDMTTELIPATVITNASAEEYNVFFTPAATGDYYFGIHCISDADDWYLNIDNFAVAAGLDSKAPDMVTDIKAVPDYEGSNRLDISFKAPMINISGSQLDGIDIIVVYRGKTLVGTIDKPAPGAVCNLSDTPEKSGVYNYSFTAINSHGTGKTAGIEAYSGVGIPMSPQSPAITHNDSEGNVTIEWEAPVSDTYGNPLNPSLIRYSVTGNNNKVYVENSSVNTASFKAVDSGMQIFEKFTVTATTASGSASVVMPMEALGTPYAVPYTESFSNGAVKHDLGILSGGGAEWMLMNDSDDVVSSDGDNGMMFMYAPVVDTSAMIWTGKLSFENVANPFFSFDIYNYSLNESFNSNEVDVMVKDYSDSDGWQAVKTFVVGNTGNLGWNSCLVPLGSLKGKIVSICLKVTSKSHASTIIDNFKIYDDLGTNISLIYANAPLKVKPDQEFAVRAKVANNGEKTIEKYTLSLFRDNELVNSRTVENKPLYKGNSEEWEFIEKLSAVSPDKVAYNVEVTCDGDENEMDNVSDVISIELQRPLLSPVRDLKGEEDGNTIRIDWNVPDLEAEIAQPVTEDFENAEAWESEVEGWTFNDGDMTPVGGFNGIDLPNFQFGMGASFVVFDSTDEQLNATFEAHSGKQYLGALYRIDYGTCDDWAISPMLEGGAQTISFFARSYSNNYPEQIEVLYSTTGNNPEDFTNVALSKRNVPENWEEYNVELPDGATYFAIHSTGTDNFFLMVDDVMFTPEPDMRGAELIGYNIYRNGKRLNSNPVVENSYIDMEPEEKSEYGVTAVYDKGESSPASVVVTTTGVGFVDNSGIKVYSIGGNIVVRNAVGNNVAIYTSTGQTIFDGKVNDSLKLRVDKGVYMVKAGAKNCKVLVK